MIPPAARPQSSPSPEKRLLALRIAKPLPGKHVQVAAAEGFNENPEPNCPGHLYYTTTQIA